MKLFYSTAFSFRLALPLALVAGLAAVTGCGRDDVKVYQVVKESPPGDSSTAAAPAAAPVPAAPSGMDASLPTPPANALPQFQFSLPPGWAEVPASQMRVASFSVTNTAGPAADVGIIPLPAGENELALVNMWRSQLQLPPTDHADSVDITVGSDPAKLYEFVSTGPVLDGKYVQRNLVAMQTHGTMSWFFKITGEDAFVASQKDVFLQFLKSFTFNDSAPAPDATASAMSALPSAPAAPDAAATDAAASIWTVPAGWQSVPPSQFLLAQYSIQSNGAQADVNISQMAGEGGGLLANVNRWRRQLGLPLVDQEADLSTLVAPLTVPGAQAQMVDFNGTSTKTGQSARLIGVVLPMNGQTWFYKLMGDPGLVAAQKDAFVKFIQSAHYPDAR